MEKVAIAVMFAIVAAVAVYATIPVVGVVAV